MTDNMKVRIELQCWPVYAQPLLATWEILCGHEGERTLTVGDYIDTVQDLIDNLIAVIADDAAVYDVTQSQEDYFEKIKAAHVAADNIEE